jgi:signal transduction histidine kinase/DNA-binding LacI/PurR family transcriptional regulator
MITSTSKPESKRNSHFIETKNTHPTIGLLIGWLSTWLQESHWLGVADAAREQDVNLICFAGERLRSPAGFEAQGNVLYDLVDTEQVAGLVIWSSILGMYLAPREMADFICRFHSLPLVSSERAFEGIPGVFQDDYQGMREAVAHLIEAHGYRRIAFIRGPKGHPATQQRYQAYTDELTEAGLPVDPNLVSPPCGWWDGATAMNLLLNERGLHPSTDFEAVVGANDMLALDAMAALQARGIRVPDQVAVVGFDDQGDARAVTPPLTTVQSPHYEMGRQTATLLLSQLRGEPVPERVTLPTALVTRQSCGCMSSAVMEAAADPGTWTNETFETALAARRKAITAAMEHAIGALPHGLDPEWATHLLDSFADEMCGGASGSFLSTLNEVLCQTVDAGDDPATRQGQGIAAWQGVISALRRHALPCIGGNEALSQAENLWQQARVLIGEIAQRVQVHRDLKTEQQAQTLREIEEALITTFDVDELMDVLAEGLPRLGIPSCYLSLYEDPQPYEYPQPAPEWSRLMLAYSGVDGPALNRVEGLPPGGRIELDPDGRRFRSRELVPKSLWPQERRYSFLVESLHFREHQLGFVLFEVGPRDGTVYTKLRAQISSALYGALLLRERKLAEEALVHSNKELRQFAYVASHVLQEPLRMVKSYLQLIERRYKGQLDADADDFIDFAVNGAERMQTLIHDLLEYSRVTTHGKLFAPTDCTTTLHHALANLEIAIEENDAVVTHDELPTVLGDETQLLRLLQNLIGNAIKFRKKETRPEIHINAERAGDEWTFSVRDNGIGIDSGYFERIFMIFQRLHSREEYEGTGIGLAVCQKIVERHGGRIWVESEPGKGSTFYFTILDSRDSAP